MWSVIEMLIVCVYVCVCDRRRRRLLTLCFGQRGKGTWLCFSCCWTAAEWMSTAKTEYELLPSRMLLCSSDCMAYDNAFCVFSQYGTSALMVASYSGHYECVRELIMQGADINLQREVLMLLDCCYNRRFLECFVIHWSHIIKCTHLHFLNYRKSI